MKRFPLFVVIGLFFISSKILAQEEKLPPLPKGPLLLTSTTSAMLSADYWIARIPNARKPIKTPEQLAHFNEEIWSTIPECVDVFKLDRIRPGKQISDQLQLEYNTLRNRKLFDGQGKIVPQSFFEEKVKPAVQIDKVPSTVKMKWGTAIRATSVRALPTLVKMIEASDDFEFDQLQFTLIKLWTPVGIYHQSSDGQWFYVQAPYVRGWVQAKDIALFPSRDDLKTHVNSRRFLVITGESALVFSDAELTKGIYRPTMGTVIPRAEGIKKGEGTTGTSAANSANTYPVWMPYRKKDGSAGLRKAYLSKKSDVSLNYPVYSQASIIRQAFKLLGARYGWGGMYNGRDCSGFVHDVFLSLGVAFPRDSKQQSQIGTQLGHFEPFQNEAEKKAVLKSARPGLTLMKMPHHQMIYLGTVNGQFYTIHSTWAERTGQDPKLDEKRRINQVVVSDLNLNGRSYVGSLFDRIISINEVD